MREVLIDEFDYDLPEERIAQNPVYERDNSKLLISKPGSISEDVFKNIDEYIPENSLLVFNNTRVIRARLLFRKSTGAIIEVLCLEPLSPSDYQVSFGSTSAVEWKCIVGNLKKWKEGVISAPFIIGDENHNLRAERISAEGDAWRIKLSWDASGYSFGEVLEAIGHTPLPPYINREDTETDRIRYQTIYSSIKGSVAAPTAGLHFTAEVLEKLSLRGIKTTEVTLHVGAGTFQPVKSANIADHQMHCEHFTLDLKTIEMLAGYEGRIIPVGTTSVRTLESLYWIGVKMLLNPIISNESFSISQWESYEHVQPVTVTQSLQAIINYMREENKTYINGSTSIIIIPGYKFRMTNGLITNFHQPRSTLLLLISAFTGEKWKEIYRFAIENEFRFLSYGDSSILL